MYTNREIRRLRRQLRRRTVYIGGYTFASAVGTAAILAVAALDAASDKYQQIKEMESK